MSVSRLIPSVPRAAAKSLRPRRPERPMMQDEDHGSGDHGYATADRGADRGAVGQPALFIDQSRLREHHPNLGFRLARVGRGICALTALERGAVDELADHDAEHRGADPDSERPTDQQPPGTPRAVVPYRQRGTLGRTRRVGSDAPRGRRRELQAGRRPGFWSRRRESLRPRSKSLDPRGAGVRDPSEALAQGLVLGDATRTHTVVRVRRERSRLEVSHELFERVELVRRVRRVMVGQDRAPGTHPEQFLETVEILRPVADNDSSAVTLLEPTAAPRRQVVHRLHRTGEGRGEAEERQHGRGQGTNPGPQTQRRRDGILDAEP